MFFMSPFCEKFVCVLMSYIHYSLNMCVRCIQEAMQHMRKFFLEDSGKEYRSRDMSQSILMATTPSNMI